MNWYGNYKEEKILIQQDGGHNKFWSAWCDENNQVHVRWGRIGTNGGSQTKDFPTCFAATRFIDGKFHEKQRKGYSTTFNGKEITQAALDRLHTEAAIVGTQNKCHDFKWVEINVEPNGDVYFREIPEERLYNPECHPAILVNLETRKDVGGRDQFLLLFTLEDTYDIPGYTNKATRSQLVSSDHPLRKMIDKVEEAIGRNLSSTV